MSVLVTGAAGFIGMAVARALVDRGEEVIGVDNLNAYYDVKLKQARLATLEGRNGFSFRRTDLAERDEVAGLIAEHPDIDRVIHLAAQPGVRHSLTDPYAYVRDNVLAHLVVAEACRALGDRLRHFVYASTSSVYGGSTAMPFSLSDPADKPASLYGATKRAAELMSSSYAHLYDIPTTGLRFFTVYGPWGRPDMSPWLFTEAILTGRPIRVFNEGRMCRDFTYIDDVVGGVVAALDRPPTHAAGRPERLYNLGNNRSEELLRYIAVIEEACGREAEKIMEPMQAGDVEATFADIGSSRRDLGFEPATAIEDGIPRFVHWFRSYTGL